MNEALASAGLKTHVLRLHQPDQLFGLFASTDKRIAVILHFAKPGPGSVTHFVTAVGATADGVVLYESSSPLVLGHDEFARLFKAGGQNCIAVTGDSNASRDVLRWARNDLGSRLVDAVVWGFPCVVGLLFCLAIWRRVFKDGRALGISWRLSTTAGIALCLFTVGMFSIPTSWQNSEFLPIKNNQESNVPLRTDKDLVDFGKVYIPDGRNAQVEATYTISNVSEHPVHIRNVETGCSCVVSNQSWIPGVIPPGSQRALNMTWEISDLQLGHRLTQHAVVVGSSIGHEVSLPLTMVAVPGAELRRYRVWPAYLDLGKVRGNRASPSLIELRSLPTGTNVTGSRGTTNDINLTYDESRLDLSAPKEATKWDGLLIEVRAIKHDGERYGRETISIEHNGITDYVIVEYRF